MAFNPLTGQAEWKVPVTETVISAGMLATDGGLLFTGRVNGEFIALDQATGQTLWQQNRLRHQFSAHNLYTQGPTICDGPVRHWRCSQPDHESCGQGPDRRVGVDLCVDA